MIIGVDIGTSLTKASLITRNGESVRTASKESVVTSGPGGRVEQDLDDVLSSVRFVIREVALGGDVEAIALTGQGDGLWLRDAAGRPVHDPVSWMDGRGAGYVADWSRGAGRGESVIERAYALTGSAIFPGSAAPLLKWFAENEPETLDAADVAGCCVDSVIARLTGETTVDASDASVPFLNPRTRRYVDEVLELCGISGYRHLLPEPAPAGSLFRLESAAAAWLGLPSGTPVTGGPFDVPASSLGAGCTDVGDGTIVVGTTLGCEVLTDDPSVRPGEEPKGMRVCTSRPDQFLRVLPAMVGTTGVSWLMNLFGRRAWHVGELLAQSPPGANGVNALSFLSPAGERGPFVDPLARGQLGGLSLQTGPADIARAMCESIAYAARNGLELGGLDGELSACGGGMQSAEWAQIFADVIGQDIHVPAGTDVGARGAAIAAWDKLGDPVDRDEWKNRRRVVTPLPANRELYERGYAAYLDSVAAARDQWNRRG